jgi:hypothetical protein
MDDGGEPVFGSGMFHCQEHKVRRERLESRRIRVRFLSGRRVKPNGSKSEESE